MHCFTYVSYADGDGDAGDGASLISGRPVGNVINQSINQSINQFIINCAQ